MLQKDSLQVTLKWWPLFLPPAGMYISRLDTRSDSHKSFSLRDYFPWRLTPGWFSSLMLARVRPLPLTSARRRAETLRVWETWGWSNAKQISWTADWGAAPVLSTPLCKASLWWMLNGLGKSCSRKDGCGCAVMNVHGKTVAANLTGRE